MTHRPVSFCWIAPPTLLLLAVAIFSFLQERGGAQEPAAAPTSLADPRLSEVRRASAVWAERTGPPRRVVDVVCLVPDLPTFFQAVATWDEGHYFPILLDDTEYTLKFLRAFRPSRVVRMPRRADPIPPEDLWGAAVAAVGRSWADEARGEAPPRGDLVPRTTPPPPPGVVLSGPESPALAGAVALAAGRFQPLLRWSVDKGPDDILTMQEAERFANNVLFQVAGIIPDFEALGDGCDFVTLASPAPYRYTLELKEAPPMLQGTACLDDLIGRGGQNLRRWAYAGRLIGDERASLYRAMCALFLQPDSALLFDGYEQSGSPWDDYRMAQAARRLTGAGLRSRHVSGSGQADHAGWHRAFGPVNRSPLVLINSSGNPTSFSLAGGAGTTEDVPPTDPVAVLKIHSFSAANPYDPETLAGRWLVHGAFVYYGSVNEPYLTSFRPPTLVTDLIAEHLPLVVAARKTLGEEFGFPWRLIFLGDPLYRLLPAAEQRPRIAWSALDDWPSYTAPSLPIGPEVSEAAKLDWSVKTAILAAARGPDAPPDETLTRAVLAIRRGGLPEPLRPTYDTLLADVLLPVTSRARLRRAYAGIPPEELPVGVRRLLATTHLADLTREAASGNLAAVGALWAELIGGDSGEGLKQSATQIAARAFEARGRIVDWQNRLRVTLRTHPEAAFLQAELERIAPQIEAARPRSRRPADR